VLSLQTKIPARSFVMLEAQDSFVDLAHAPLPRDPLRQRPLHVRLPFQAWTSARSPPRPSIRLSQATSSPRNDLQRHIRYGHPHATQPRGAARTTAERDATLTETRRDVTFSASFLCDVQGYYRHARGYTPQCPGWKSSMVRSSTPNLADDLESRDKEVIVIGSGRTARVGAGHCRMPSRT